MNNCADQLPICNAECCKQFVLILPRHQNPEALVRGAHLCFYKICIRDAIRYYKLHGCKYQHGVISFDLGEFNLEDNRLTVIAKCEGLTEELQCKYHDTIKQPIICRTPDKDNYINIPGVTITPNCKYNKEAMKDE